jgi:ferredoxin
MIRLTIDNRPVEVENGTTILDAARKLGIEIPTMCWVKEFAPSTSCMVCIVRINGSQSLVPSCATKAVDGMQVESQSEVINAARRTAVELLLSDHAGDCEGPCRIGCPAEMEIPLMIRQISAGKLKDAIRTVKRDIALPAALGRICPAPCEKVCRRRQKDNAVSICLLKRYVADVDLASGDSFVPECAKPVGKTVAVVGAGPAGLAAAYQLTQKGFTVTVYEARERAGGGLLTEELKDRLPQAVVNAEVMALLKTGFRLVTGQRAGVAISWENLRKNQDAVFLAMGGIEDKGAAELGIEVKAQTIVINKLTYQTSVPGIFAGGNAAGAKRRLAVRAMADGKEAAESIAQFLTGQEVTGVQQRFNCRMGKLLPEDLQRFTASADPSDRVTQVDMAKGFTNDQAVAESRRCLHCDCRKNEACRLRDCAQVLGAKAVAYDCPRREFQQDATSGVVIYESGKCIDCGLCIQVSHKYREQLGLTFIGRGFTVRVAVPFGGTIAEGLKQAGGEAARLCPTGALALTIEY